MATQARVASLDALGTFRSRLIVFINKAQNSVEEVADEVRRTRAWLESEQRVRWEMEIRRRRAHLSQAEAELMSARLSSLRENIAAQQMAVRKARAALAEAEEKLRLVKLWIRNFDSQFEPLTRKLDSFRHYSGVVLPKGVQFLHQVQNTLAAYSEIAPGPVAQEPSEAQQ